MAGSLDGAGHQKYQRLISAGTFSQAHPLISGKEEGLAIELITNGQRFDYSCLCNETSIKTPKRQGSEEGGTSREGTEALYH